MTRRMRQLGEGEVDNIARELKEENEEREEEDDEVVMTQ
jgi:hypothetical protein